MMPYGQMRMDAMLTLLTALLAAAPMAVPHGPVPITDGRPLVTSADYPIRSLAGLQEGMVQVRLTVNRNGEVDQCTVGISSGWPELDQNTCLLIATRARFHPARNARGQRIAGEVVRRIRWSIPR